MLNHFLYLNTDSLTQYVSTIDGGAITESTRRSLRSGSASAKVGVKAIEAGGDRGKELEESQTLADTEAAQFSRLLTALDHAPETWAYIDVMDPSADFPTVGTGQMVRWECNIYVPEVVQVMARSGEAVDMMNMMKGVLPMAGALGLDTAGMPDAEQLGAMTGLLQSLNASLVVIGEDDDTDWQIAGTVKEQFVRGDFDGRALVVGKVSKVVPEGKWQPLLAFPGMNLLSREQRRKAAKTKPSLEEENQYLAGPAVMLEILAIYR